MDSSCCDIDLNVVQLKCWIFFSIALNFWIFFNMDRKYLEVSNTFEGTLTTSEISVNS